MAFVGEFERRWKQASGAQKHSAERVKKLLTRLGPHIEMILVKGDASEELITIQNYHISLVALIANLKDEDQVLTPPLEMGGVRYHPGRNDAGLCRTPGKLCGNRKPSGVTV